MHQGQQKHFNKGRGELNKKATETECHMQQRLQKTTESVVGDLGICSCMFFLILLQLLNTLVKIPVYLKLFIQIVHDLLPAGVGSYPIKYDATSVLMLLERHYINNVNMIIPPLTNKTVHDDYVYTILQE